MTFDFSARAGIVAAAERAAPEECCGLLLGTRAAVVEAWPARNLAPDPRRRYDIDPVDHFAALRDARRRGLEVVGCYHSHPRSAPAPSPTDAADALPEFLYVIAGRTPEDASWTLAAFRLVGANFVPVGLVSTP